MKPLLPILCVLVMATPLRAQETPPDTADLHVVRPGDTLWDLAGRYLSNPYLWSEIYRLNRDVVADPNRIYPAERLRIPGLVVQPRALETAEGGPDRSVFFGRRSRDVGTRIAGLETARVPIVTPGDYFRAGVLIQDDEIGPLGVLAEVISPSVVRLGIPRSIQLYDRVFVKLNGRSRVGEGDRLQLVRPGRAVATYGRIYTSTGLATVVTVERDVATIQVDVMHHDVAVGDLVVPVPAFPVRVGETPRPGSGLEGRILAFESPHALQAVEDVAFVDLGRESGLKEGDELAIVLPRVQATWGLRPEILVGRVQVVRVSRRTAAVRVVALEQPALEPGIPVRLIARMP